MLDVRKVVNILQSLGYRYRRETKRTRIFRKDQHEVGVRKARTVSEVWFRSVLRQAGITEQVEIDQYVRNAR